MKLLLRELDGQKCSAYLKGRLDGMLYFSNRISRELNLDKGKFYTIIPKGITEEYLYEFETGGRVYPFEREVGVQVVQVINHSEDILISSLHEYVTKDKSHWICLEDYLAEPGHKYIKESNRQYHLIEERMFYLMNSTFSLEDIKQYFRRAVGFGFLCMLFKMPSLGAEPGGTLGDPVKEAMFEGISSFLVEIYDGDGYLIWIGDKEGNIFLDSLSKGLDAALF